MKKELYEWDSRSLDAKCSLPSERFFTPNEMKDERATKAARETLHDAEFVVIGDADADGLGAVAAIREATGEEVSFVPAGPHGGGLYLGQVLELAATEIAPGAEVIIEDICIDATWKAKALPAVAERAGWIGWFDHHEWSDEVFGFVSEHVDYIEIDTATDEPEQDWFTARCAAMMVRDYYADRGHEYTEKFNEAIDVTGEYDLWRLRDDRCYDLNDLTHVVDAEEYIALFRSRGADVLKNDRARSLIEEYRAEQTALHDRALATLDRYRIGDWTVATVYGNCSQNDVAETIREDGLADAIVVVKPHGGISLRGSESFTRCHEVAQSFGGGGHEKAAGAFPDAYDDLLDYSTHWTTNGERTIAMVIQAFQALAEADQADETASSEPAQS